MDAILASFSELQPLYVAAASIGLLLVLILKFKLQAFIALLIASIFVGLFTGMPVTQINASIQSGMGGALGFIATIIGLGSIFGKILEHSGGTEALARQLLKTFGQEKAPWAMMITGFAVSIPVFLDAGLVILAPIVYALTRESGKPILAYAIPLLAGMAVTHSFVPPTPGPIAVAELLGADLGWVILFGFIIGVPTAILAGPVFGKYIATKITVGVPKEMDDEGDALKRLADQSLPAFSLISVLIGLPLFLILANSVIGVLVKKEVLAQSVFTDYAQFIGHPFSALILSTLLAIYFLGIKRGSSKEEIMEICTKSLGPAGIIILITGAGGVFKQILIDSKVAGVLGDLLSSSNLHFLVLGYIIALFVRIAQGSATVAMITAASLLGPILETMGTTLGAAEKALLVVAIAAGATFLSHVNDSGFWLVSRYIGLTEKETLRSWTVMSVIISVCGFGFAMLLSLVV